MSEWCVFADKSGYQSSVTGSEKHKYGYELKGNRHYHHTNTGKVRFYNNELLHVPHHFDGQVSSNRKNFPNMMSFMKNKTFNLIDFW